MADVAPILYVIAHPYTRRLSAPVPVVIKQENINFYILYRTYTYINANTVNYIHMQL